MPLAGRSADIKVTSSVGVASTNNAMTRSTGAGSANGYVAITASSRRHWDDDATPVLYRAQGGSTAVVSSTNYSVNYVQGRFEWVSGDPSTGTYTADVSYLTATSVAGGREWTLGIEQDMFEVSTFGSSGWKRFMPNLAGASATVGRYWTDVAFFDQLVLSGKFVAEFIVSSTGGEKYEAYVRVGSDQVNTAVDAIVGETINLSIDGNVYYST